MRTALNPNSEALTALCQTDLSTFVREAWPTVVTAEPFQDNWHVEAICEHLEALARREFFNLLINVPPRFGKSVLCSVMFPAWLWVADPTLRMVYSSYSQRLSTRDSVATRRLIESEWYRSQWGDRFNVTTDQNEKTLFENDKRGFRLATSVGGVATGEGGDLVVADDPHNVTEAESDVVRAGVLEWWNVTMPSRTGRAGRASRLVIMQRVHEKDLAGDIIEKGNYVHLCLPMEYEPARARAAWRGWTDPRRAEGELLWPARFSEKVIADSLRPPNMTSYAYACTPYEAPVLMGDLSLRPIGEVKEGDVVIGFARGLSGRRKLVRTVVEHVGRSTRDVARVALKSGRVIRCTPEHKWWTRIGHKDKYRPAQVGLRLRRVCDTESPALSDLDELKLALDEDQIVSMESGPREDVFSLQTATGNYVVWGFASSNSQYQQRPAPLEGGMFQRAWWKYYAKDPAALLEEARRAGNDCCQSWDCTFKETGESYVVGQVWVRVGVDFYLVHQTRSRMNFMATKQAIKLVSAKFPGVVRKLVEDKANGTAVIDDLRASVPGLVPVEPRGGKESRANQMQGFVQGGNVWLPERAPWVEDFVEEFRVFPNGANDDQVDAASQAITDMFTRYKKSFPAVVTSWSRSIVRNRDARYRDPRYSDEPVGYSERGDMPRPAAHDVASEAHRAGCRVCRAGFRTL